MDQLISQRHFNAGSVLDGRFLDSKTLYLHRFGRLPNLYVVERINAEKAYGPFRERFGHLIEDEYQYRNYDKGRKRFEFDETFFILKNGCIVLLDTYSELLHDGTQEAFVNEAAALLSSFRERSKRQPREINLIVRGASGLQLKAMEIRPAKLDVDLFYEADFAPVDAVIRKRLGRKDDKGIVLLHGLPGTGKTSYLRYLVGKINKRVLFLSPNVAGNLTDPSFIDLLVDNPNTVLVIEDAENVLMDRRANSQSGVSNLLNISDGLLADFLNVQLVCTFNSPVALIDAALLRKGRLIARYEFGKLGAERAQRLSDHLGFRSRITRPMTVAEIAGQSEPQLPEQRVEVIGFRSAVLDN
ncbi:AAA family ATPase [Flaviaesturariibacter amylovorans]|uniref:ATPase AAA-type core domain-containing protein n=1 Tax=Flaviaesturariibacter amylovorans TaxID=1084520 RepID=A0ABP8GB05_9BACT